MLDLLFILILLVSLVGLLCSAISDSDVGKLITGFIAFLSISAIIIF